MIIDGKKIAEEIKNEVKQKVEEIAAKGLPVPKLAVVVAGDDTAAGVYVGGLKKVCGQCGIEYSVRAFGGSVTQDELLAEIERLNNDAGVSAVLTQMPLPKGIDEARILAAISPDKDADGFHPYNTGLLSQGAAKLPPCTPAGVIELLKRSGIGIAGKHCVVIGRSNIVGKPVSQLLLRENGTVTVCHSKTEDLKKHTLSADILVAAIGKPKFVTPDMVKPGSAVIDVGIHRVDGKLCGDVDFDAAKDIAGYITPVPGGVGSMTTAMLMRNCLTAYEMRR
jgi:methylenetetrahydrofolate dehydrogenase (NADP+)/methenyltetrahydrofolate cyclohydrolase